MVERLASLCGSVDGIGRHVRLRSGWGETRTGSSPVRPTKFVRTSVGAAAISPNHSIAEGDMKFCKRCGLDKNEIEFYKHSGRTHPMTWCKKCVNDYSAEKQRVIKKRAVALLGGKCAHCGYSKCIRALEFHHPDPSIKHKAGRSYGAPRTRGWKRYWEEISKCILLCANCHREEEQRLSEGV